jgi:hypothetical protein
MGAGKLAESNKMNLFKWSKTLLTLLDTLPIGFSSIVDRMLPLVALMFRALEKEYPPLAHRYLAEVCGIIEATYAPECPFLLEGLKEFEATSIKPSDMAIRLEFQPPSRSPAFRHSEESMIRCHSGDLDSTPNP